MAHQPSLQARHTIYSGTTMQENQPAVQIAARQLDHGVDSNIFEVEDIKNV